MKISVLIPCFNEEKSIKRCVESCLNQSRKPDEIVVVDDGSTDRSYDILRSFGRKIRLVRNRRNLGNKSFAQEAGLRVLTGDVFITADADSVLGSDFVKRVSLAFEADPELVAFAGYVKSLKNNWITACREIDYLIGQIIHKTAQQTINSLFVIPGCGGAFKAGIFREFIGFDHDTVTEDLDFTYKVNLKRFKIHYDRKAVVYTQDPPNLKSYLRQMRRWYSGGWQCLLKHSRSVRRVGTALELSLIYVEGLVFSVLLFLVPLINVYFLAFLVLPHFLVGLAFSFYGAAVDRNYKLPFYTPLFVFLIFVNSAVFVYSFAREILLHKRELFWLRADRGGLLCSR